MIPMPHSTVPTHAQFGAYYENEGIISSGQFRFLMKRTCQKYCVARLEIQ
jgi:hypothetical protein